MSRYQVHRSDVTAEARYACLRAHGAAIIKLGRPMDALVIFAGRMCLVDVKESAHTEMSEGQIKLLALYPDLCFLLYDDEDCKALLQVMRAR